MASVAFLRATDLLMTLVCVAAGLGWTAWWYQRQTTGADADEGSEVQEGTSAKSGALRESQLSAGKQTGASFSPDAPMAALDFDPKPLVEDVKAALAEADQAVSVAIGAFIKIAEEAQQISECAGEMMRWRQNTTPVIQETVNHLTERSAALSENLNEVIVAFQFHDGLSQRLQHTAASLERLIAPAPNAEDASAPAPTHKMASQPVDYGAQATLQDATLF